MKPTQAATAKGGNDNKTQPVNPAADMNGAPGSVAETKANVLVKQGGELSELERSILAEAGIPTSEVEELSQFVASRGSKAKAAEKVNLPALVGEHAAAMVVSYRNKPLLSAEAVGTYVISAGLHAPVRGFNAFGDACGGHGHHLPSVVYHGKRRYDLSMVGKTSAEKVSRQEQLRSLRVEVIARLIAELPELPAE